MHDLKYSVVIPFKVFCVMIDFLSRGWIFSKLSEEKSAVSFMMIHFGENSCRPIAVSNL